MANLAGFLGIAVIVIVTPGPDTALTVRNTLAGGRRAGTFTALGVSTGQATWTLASSLGIAALLVASEPAFLTVRVAGAAYLVFLGVGTLWRAVRARQLAVVGQSTSPALCARTAFRHGLLSNLGNPKMAVFFTSLLPQFIGAQSSFVAPLLLGLLFCSLTLTWLSAYAFAVARAGGLLVRGRARRALDTVTGLVLVGFGTRMAAAAR